ncbi:OLC1v1002537C1 [Oldenlandia corymbosa var. corymbosa]|uniref:OLC1v1002537C1 n=1 Tax=Oldenlandia corymbosa var. corymbosa TaxID=529605 RepID=A0AAV1D818_OLDCO|nr:OLC1v1002537C1 [Oldenlandia corymbosa var. corymbosa]
MPSADKPSSALPFVSFRRPILTMRGGNVHALALSRDCDPQNSEMESFQRQVLAQFHSLAVATNDEFLSLSWIRKLLDAFASCQELFREILSNNKGKVSKPPVDKFVLEYFDRTIKALDICNATRDGIEKIRQWKKHLDIVVAAMDCHQKMIGEGNIRRAKKALTDLALFMLDDKGTGSVFSHRNRSFGRAQKNKERQNSRGSGHSRSLSWSVPNSWSASKQLQTMANNLVIPRANELAAANSLSNVVFTMSFILMFVLWTLVAAFPCQDRGHQVHFTIPRQFVWSTPFFLLHSRITDESKKRGWRDSNGFLREINRIEKSIHHMTDLVDSVQVPLAEEQKEEVRESVKELAIVCEICNSELDPLERNLRDVFRKIMSCRTEGLQILGKSTQP